MAFSMKTFMQEVYKCNPSFKKHARHSDLDPLIKALGGESGQTFYNPSHRPKIEKETHALKTDKAVKYRAALMYLARELGVDPGPIPVSPKMVMEEFRFSMGGYTGKNAQGQTKQISLNPRGFVLVFKLKWASSNGDLKGLSNVGTRENIRWRTDPTQTPFNYVQGNTPMTFQQGATSNTGGAGGECGDDHSTVVPDLICLDPRVAGSHVAEQSYEYTCDGTLWKPIPGAAYLIEKGVKQGGPTGWLYFFKKTNWTPRNTKTSRFEVEYPVGPAPEYMPVPGTEIFGKNAMQEADINQYAYRVVRS
jgi:hypothetical protein